MLTLPERPTPLRVIGIDPGTTTLGVARLDYDFEGPEVDVVDAFTLVARESHPGYQSVLETYGNKYARLQNLQDCLTTIFHDHRPHAVICEQPYLGRFAAAYMALTECAFVIHQALFAYDPYLPLWRVEPRPAKIAAGVVMPKPGSKEKLTKDHVRDALAQQPHLRWGVPLADLDEHAVDATAVGLYFMKELL